MIDAQLPSQLDEFRCGRKIREETGRPPRVAPVAWKFRGAARCRCARLSTHLYRLWHAFTRLSRDVTPIDRGAPGTSGATARRRLVLARDG